MAALTIAADAAALADLAAERVTRHLEETLAARGIAMVSLTGGSTPRVLYEHLADPERPWRRRIDWSRLQLFWGDERYVPPDHPDSNFAMAQRALIAHVPVPPSSIHPMPTSSGDPAADAAAYAMTIDSLVRTRDRAAVTFDLLLLGLGEDGHIASIFPGSPLLAPDAHLASAAAAVWASHLHAWRLTLTPAVLTASAAILVITEGAAKAAAVHAAVEAPLDVSRYPVQLLRSAGDRVEWLVDRAAARLIDG